MSSSERSTDPVASQARQEPSEMSKVLHELADEAAVLDWRQNWLRVLWLRAIYWPYWDVRVRLGRAWKVQKRDTYILTFEELMEATARWDEHPDDWGYPCKCRECLRHAD